MPFPSLGRPDDLEGLGDAAGNTNGAFVEFDSLRDGGGGDDQGDDRQYRGEGRRATVHDGHASSPKADEGSSRHGALVDKPTSNETLRARDWSDEHRASECSFPAPCTWISYGYNHNICSSIVALRGRGSALGLCGEQDPES